MSCNVNFNNLIILFQETGAPNPLDVVGTRQPLGGGMRYYQGSSGDVPLGGERVATVVGAGLRSYVKGHRVHASGFATTTVICTGQRSLVVHNVYIHPDWRNDDDTRQAYESIIGDITAEARAGLRRGEVHIVGGDFNTHPYRIGDSPLGELDAVGFVNTVLDAGVPFTYCQGGHRSVIDYVFHAGLADVEVRPLVVAPHHPNASDHRMLMLNFMFAPMAELLARPLTRYGAPGRAVPPDVSAEALEQLAVRTAEAVARIDEEDGADGERLDPLDVLSKAVVETAEAMFGTNRERKVLDAPGVLQMWVRIGRLILRKGRIRNNPAAKAELRLERS